MNVPVSLIDPATLPAPAEDAGVGCLRTDRGNLPLDEIDVAAAICGLATHVELTQGFRNTFAEPLEATYIFPLPPRAAVTALRMEADGRVVEGMLKEREQARHDYDVAIGSGKRASIAEEERPGVFTMRVGNIMPGERVTVRLTLAGQLSYEDGMATFRFPLVVAPRYVPGRPLPGDQVGSGVELDTDAVPDASRITPPVLLPGFPNPVRLSIEVGIDPAGLPLTAVESSLHTVVTEDGAAGPRVRLTPGERADRDFILRLRLGSDDAVSTSLAVRPDDEGGTFALTVLPPVRTPLARPRDVVLVLDRSGSMGGWKMVAARRAAARIVDTLTAEDRFAVLAFDNVVETPRVLPEGLVDATDRNRFRAVEYLAGLSARGGTEMLEPLRRAARQLGAAGDRDRVLVLVTDGQIGNEDQILRELAPLLSGVRVHTVGVDRLVNEAFLQRLAGLAGGRCELVESEDRLDEAMAHIHRRIATPVVTGLSVQAAGLAADLASLAPNPLPDLYAGAPVIIGGRFTGAASGSLTVTGDGGWSVTVAAMPSDNAALAALWARARIRDLEDRYVTAPSVQGAGLDKEIVDVSLRFGVLSRFTAFVAVDERVVNEGGTLHRVTQPVDAPSGWELGTFGGVAGAAMPLGLTAMPTVQTAAHDLAGGIGAAALLRGTQYSVPGAIPGTGRPAAPRPEPVVPLRTFARFELRGLRGAAAKPVAERSPLLTALAESIRKVLASVQGEEPEARRALEELATVLAGPTTDEAELERRWALAISTLETLAGERSRRTFWKR
jgi:Ca-activated chloride channel family protein